MMVPAAYYSLIYTILVILFAIPVLIKYANGSFVNNDYRAREPARKSIVFTIIIILFVGCRPNSPIFADGPGYWYAMLDHRWEHYSLESVNYQYTTKWLMSFMSSMGISPRLCFIVLSAVVYGGAYISMRKMFPSDTLLAMILFCGTFGVFEGAVNGIKNGMACSMFLCAVAYRKQWKKCLIFLLLAIGFHHAMQLSIGAFVVCLLYNKTNTYYFVWICAVIIAFLHITYFQTLFANFTDDHAASYLLADENSIDVWGFRWDFILYSTFPLVLGLWVKSKIDISHSEYQFILNLYLVMNSIWLLCMYAAFSNRFASLSWSLFPILILKPLLNSPIAPNQNKILVWYIVGQLAFSLIMGIIYMNRYWV